MERIYIYIYIYIIYYIYIYKYIYIYNIINILQQKNYAIYSRNIPQLVI